ncbi:helix-turn-helix transcriptional regulator [Streptomyces sp. H27-C3]|uniref:helix-turn-helix domain-containing protein n=1 Tax=Streptomyces sp. H27-C3 TaxID=3046305 RepID=UPI0024B8AAFE|nr:helix-turn-helix transcriptional regulator [Streptomyces sp. H27-C3]MDJ0464437.1 helix-turn-helix transcriptional regulator [Streptomyces sp. H27-C3]
MSTADLVRTWRTAQGLSQAELAERAGTGQAVISRIESGKLTPTLPVLERLAAALDCKVILDFAPRG